MQKKIIAVDIDDVLAAEAKFVIDYSNKHWGLSLGYDDYSEDWCSMWDVDYDERERRAAEMNQPGFQTSYELIEGGREVLEELEELVKHYKLVILTSRLKPMQAEIEAWFDRVFPGLFSEMHFTGFWETGESGGHLLTKGDLAKQIGADYIIDDQPKHCFAAAKAGIQAIVFGDYGVSRGLALPAGVTRCKDWAAVSEYFREQ